MGGLLLSYTFIPLMTHDNPIYHPIIIGGSQSYKPVNNQLSLPLWFKPIIDIGGRPR